MSKNLATTTIVSHPGPPTSATSVTVATGTGPRLFVGMAVIHPADAVPTSANAEVVSITDVTGDVVTIVRAQESSTARAIATGDILTQGITAAMWDTLVSSNAGKAAASHVHSATDVTSGTLPLARGGTGGTDAATARTSLGLGTAATMTPATIAADPALTATYAPLASPALTGNPTAPTPALSDNDTSIATTAFATPRPSGTPTVGQVPVVSQASPLALSWGTLSQSANGMKRVFGAVGDMRVVTDATVIAGSTSLTSPTAAFTAGDVGKTVAIPYAGADNGTLTVGRTHLTTIAAVVSATQVTLANAPTKSITAPRTITDGSISNNGSTLTSATANWTSADIGKRIVIPGAGRVRANAQSADMVTWIVAIQSPTVATVLGSSRATVSGRTVAIPGAWVGVGTDDTAAFTAAANARGSIEIEPGRYMVTQEVPVLSRTTWWGYGAGRSIVSYCGVGGSLWRYEGGTQNSGTITDVTFRDFEIDGSGSRVATYSSVNKGIYITNCIRLTCANMYIHDTSATAFGCDFLPDGYMVGNVIERGGAQVPELGGTAGGSGFGIGTGFFSHEAFTIIGNTVRWCGKNGIFTESQSGNIRSRGARIIGNHVEDCGFGISDRACDGTIIQGNTVVAGWGGSTGIYVGFGFVAGLYSISAQVLDNVVICEGQSEGITSITNAGDLTIRGNDIRLAGTAGIRVTTTTGGTLGTVLVDGNSCLDMQGTARGIWLDTGTWDRVIVRSNRIRNCGAPATPRPGIVSAASAAAMYITDNIIWDNRGGSAGMSYGLQLTGGTITRLVYDGNDTVGAITAQQDLTGATVTTTVTNTNP